MKVVREPQKVGVQSRGQIEPTRKLELQHRVAHGRDQRLSERAPEVIAIPQFSGTHFDNNKLTLEPE